LPTTIRFIVVLAVLGRGVALVLLVRHPLLGDDTLYDDFAMRLLQGKTIFPLVPPALGYYLAFFYRLFGASPLVARACMLPLAIAFMYAFYAIGVRFAGRKGTNLAALVFAIYPLHVLCSVKPLTELPTSFLLLMSLFFVLAINVQGRLRDFTLLGVVLGVLILTRPSALLILAFLPIYLACRLRKWIGSALVAIIPTLMLAAWILTVYRSTGHFVIINFSSTQNLFLGNNAYTPLYRTWWACWRLRYGLISLTGESGLLKQFSLATQGKSQCLPLGFFSSISRWNTR